MQFWSFKGSVRYHSTSMPSSRQTMRQAGKRSKIQQKIQLAQLKFFWDQTTPESNGWYIALTTSPNETVPVNGASTCVHCQLTHLRRLQSTRHKICHYAIVCIDIAWQYRILGRGVSRDLSRTVRIFGSSFHTDNKHMIWCQFSSSLTFKQPYRFLTHAATWDSMIWLAEGY